jgi:cell division protein FtsW
MASLPPDPARPQAAPWTPGPASRFSRGDRSMLGRWWWTVDKPLLTLVLVLMLAGLIAVAAASPVGARRLSGVGHEVAALDFLRKQIGWAAVALPLMLLVSMLPVRWVQRLALLGTAMGLLALVAVMFLGGGESNGAARWLQIAGVKLVQPSEFFKPCFVVATAWLLALRFEDRDAPVLSLSFLSLCLVAGLLVLQPDYGQTVLIASIWLVQALMAGMSVQIFLVLLGVGAAGLTTAYLFVGHFAARIDKFAGKGGNVEQIEKALDCFRSGGLFGTGPGEGHAKFALPEAQTDYIFSVIGEEFGLFGAMLVAGLFVAIVVRALLAAMEEDDPFVSLSISGLAGQFGAQAFINMLVNVKLLPSKGMTLPFISYGGSSFLACALGMGMLLAFTRRNAFLKQSPFLAGWRTA